MEQIDYKVHPKENIYFTVKLLVCLIIYPAMGYGLYLLYNMEIPLQAQIFLMYAFFIMLFLVMRMGLFIGYLKGNAVKINEQQLPEVYEIVKRQSQALNMPHAPQVYLMQAGGLLNAFATRFMGTNYVVIYSDILSEAFENNIQAVEFIIGHELGHVKRKHILKRMLLFPSFVIPFLNSAYSRACEYTCDNIGATLSPKGVRNGLLILASGNKLYSRVNAERYMLQSNTEDGFWPWFSEKVSSHPRLASRILKYKDEEYNPIARIKPALVETRDHSAYFPKQ